jgi:histidinol-phosphatase
MTWRAELDFAHHLADLADEITIDGFARRIAARVKHDGTPVTDADEAAERALRAEIAKAFPEAAVLGEEQGAVGTSSTRWILDPIDGTKNYAAGIPLWGTLIALEVDGEVTCGVVSVPILRERYSAARGMGAELNGAQIRVSPTSTLDAARVAYTSFLSFDEHGRGTGWRRLCSGAVWARGLGDCWGHMLVASGRADVMAEPVVNVWDLAPLIVILEEAGGTFSDLDGNRTIDGGSALSTNGLLHAPALELLARDVSGR